MALSGLLGSSATAAVSDLVARENQRPGTDRWLIYEAREREIEGYASTVSAAPGDSIAFHISTVPAAAFTIEIYRLGWYGGAGATRKACLPFCGGVFPGEPRPVANPISPTNEVRAGWPESTQWTIPDDWLSGYYLAKAVLTSGPTPGRADWIPFIVRAPPDRTAQIIAQVPVNTWQAYNGWGEKSLYPFNSSNGARANRVSFDRPYFIGAGRQEVTGWELASLAWLEANGYDVAYQTDVDTHRRPDSLLQHRLVMTLGHGEYWTREMRDAFEHARSLGTNLAFMGANTAYWQVRYENDERTIVGYKSLYDPEPILELKTALFREVGRPECALIGVQHQGGLQNWGNHDYTVAEAAASDPWFRDTGFEPGDEVRGVVSVERDSVPDSGCGSPTVLFRYEAGGDTLGDAESVRYTADSGARVFSTGSFDFATALVDFRSGYLQQSLVDARLQRFMTNAMSDLLKPGRPTAISAASDGRAVVLRVERQPDPRSSIVILRRTGAATAPLTDLGWRIVCRERNHCVDRRRRCGWYRYAAAAFDQWGVSEPTYSNPVRIRRAVAARGTPGPGCVRLGVR